MKTILLVEDSVETHIIVSRSLEGLADLTWVQSLSEARQQIEKNIFDLILLDMELPDGNGVDLCPLIHAVAPETSLFFLTSHEALSEKVMGFSAGADDYITKPFAPLELKARVEARFKKLDLLKKTADIMKWNEIKINKIRQEVFIKQDQDYNPIELTSLEFKLLTYFASKPYQVIHRDELLDELWGEDVHVYARSVDTHVSKLRKKLGPISEIIKSVHGTGYKFNPKQ